MNSNKFRMVYKVDGNPQLDSSDWSIYSNILKNALVYELKTLHTLNFVIKETKDRTVISNKQNVKNKGGLYTPDNKTNRKIQAKNKTY